MGGKVGDRDEEGKGLFVFDRTSKGQEVQEGEEGEETVLFLHGMLCSHRIWKPTIQQVIKRWDARQARGRCLAVDLLGFGQSPYLGKDETGYTPHEHAQAVRQVVVDRLRQRGARLHVVGHSLGSMIGLELLRKELDGVEIASVTLFAPPWFPSREEALRDLASSSRFGFFIRNPTLSRVTCELVCQNREFWDRILPPLLRKQYPRFVIEDILRHSYYSADSTFRNCILDARYEDTVQDVARRGLNVRVVCPGDDELIPRGNMELLASRLGCASEELAGCKHDFLITQGDLVAKVVDERIRGSG